QYAPPLGQPIGGWAGYPQPGAFPAQALFGSPQGQFGTVPGLAGPLSGQLSVPFGTSGGWPGRPHTFGVGAQGGFPTLGGQSLGQISAWPPQIASQLLASQLLGGVGRGFQPYQATSPMACVA